MPRRSAMSAVCNSFPFQPFMRKPIHKGYKVLLAEASCVFSAAVIFLDSKQLTASLLGLVKPFLAGS